MRNIDDLLGPSNIADEGQENKPEKMTFTKMEWWDVVKELRPEMTWPEYEKLWASFEKYKSERPYFHGP